MRIGVPMNEVFIVDDDPSVRAALAVVLSSEGFQVTSFGEGEAFLSAARARDSRDITVPIGVCVASAISLSENASSFGAISRLNYPAPVLVISGRGDIPTAIDAIRNGALDFIEKPFDPSAVATRVRDAIDAWANLNRNDSILARDFPGHERLTARERDVLERIASGASNKEAGRELGISPRTIEVHRARIMEKLAAKNAADLMRIVLRGGRRH